MRTWDTNKSCDETRCSGDSLPWCLGQINFARHKLVRLTWSTLNVVCEKKKKNHPQNLMSKFTRSKEKCNTWKVLLFHIIFRGKITDVQLDERSQRKNWLPGENKSENHCLKPFLDLFYVKKGKTIKDITFFFFSNSFFSEWMPFLNQ